MSGRIVNRYLLTIALVTLALGYFEPAFWIASTLVGFFPAVTWVVADLKSKNVGSDFLAVFSLIGTLLVGEFFAGSVISLMLASGRVLENWAEGQAERQLNSLLSRIPRVAHRISIDGDVEDTSVEEILLNDQLIVKSGEIVPTDGYLLGLATLDESALTGEPMPVMRMTTEEISSGVVNAGKPFNYKVSKIAAESTYSSIIKLVKAAQARTSPGVQFAHKWALAFIPVTFVLAMLAWALTGDATRAVAVFVAATPCPLILAVPIAVVSGLSSAAKHGAVIKGGAVLEALAKAEKVLLDKTGTITHGGPVVGEIHVSPESTVEQVLQLAASVEQYSQNIIAKALVEEAKLRSISMLNVLDADESYGHHISGVINGKKVVVGQLVQTSPVWMKLEHSLLVAVSVDDELLGVIGLNDPIRPESKKLISQLRKLGVQEIMLVTGDNLQTAQVIAEQVGITSIYSHAKPEDKLRITREAMEDAKGSVIVVGDGINDAPALAAADVGVAMGARGATAASEAADVVIVDDSIDRLTTAIAISQRSQKKAVQSAGIGMALSLGIMLTGSFGITSVSQGALAQELIDVVAILWALTSLRDK